MDLQDKYRELIDTAGRLGATDLQVREQNGVLYIDGAVPGGAAKDQLWELYNRIDPDFRAGDLVLDVKVTAASGQKVTVTTDHSNLNIRKGPGTDQPIVGKAAHGETITLISQSNAQWWLVRTDAGEEGYAYAQYLTPVA